MMHKLEKGFWVENSASLTLFSLFLVGWNLENLWKTCCVNSFCLGLLFKSLFANKNWLRMQYFVYKTQDSKCSILLVLTYIFTDWWSGLPISPCPDSSFAMNFRVSKEFVFVVTMNRACVVFIFSCTRWIAMRNWVIVSTPLSASYHSTTVSSPSLQIASPSFSAIQ